jgi:hypothetical protein
MSRRGLWYARIVQIAWTYAFVRWWQWHELLRSQQRIRTRCEQREQRLEEADVSTTRLASLHSLAYVAFATDDGERALVDPLLDQFTELALQRRWYAGKLLLAPARVRVRWELRLRVLDDDLADLDALIRLYCERAIYARCG